MQTHQTAEAYLSKVIQRLKEDGFQWHDETKLQSLTIKGIASKRRFELTKGGFSEYFFIFQTATDIDPSLLAKFSSEAFDKSVAMKKTPLPRGLFSAVWCFPVVITETVDSALADSVQGQAPQKHWASAEIPAIFELRSNTLYFFQKTPLWGAAYYAGFREMIRKYLTV